MKTLLEVPTHDGHKIVLTRHVATDAGGVIYEYKVCYHDPEAGEDYAVVTYHSTAKAGADIIERLESESESAS